MYPNYLCSICKLIGVSADTENHTLVRNYIISTLRKLNWHIEEDSFVDTTPYGPKNFTNVIATKDPDAPRRVVLAAHFDSKFFPSYPENQACPSTSCRSPRHANLSFPPLFLSLTV
jgi:putative aminopeptidase FrvX